MNFTHPDIIEVQNKGHLGEQKFLNEVDCCCKLCSSFCKHEICDSCIDDAIADDKTRLAYINSNQEFIGDWKEYTNEFWNNRELPDESDLETFSKMVFVSKEALKSIDSENIYSAVASMAWINEDRPDYIDWLANRKEVK